MPCNRSQKLYYRPVRNATHHVATVPYDTNKANNCNKQQQFAHTKIPVKTVLKKEIKNPSVKLLLGKITTKTATVLVFFIRCEHMSQTGIIRDNIIK